MVEEEELPTESTPPTQTDIVSVPAVSTNGATFQEDDASSEV
jgi:hypothetical protein